MDWPVILPSALLIRLKMTAGDKPMPTERPLILTVADDAEFCRWMDTQVRGWGLDHCSASCADDCWTELSRIAPQVVLLDTSLQNGNGPALLRAIKQRDPDVPVIVIRGETAASEAAGIYDDGAFDLIIKPPDIQHLRVELGKAIEYNRMAVRLRVLESSWERADSLGMIGSSEAMRRMYEHIESIATTDGPVLITGEMGVGKELAARAIHQCGRRRHLPFITLNCAAVPQSLGERALFGESAEGAGFVTGGTPGCFELARSGAIYIEEIGELDNGAQLRLSSLIKEQPANQLPRIIASTSRDPLTLIDQGRIERPLYEQLRQLPLNVPPLRERSGDIALLARHFLLEAARRHDRPMRRLTPGAVQRLEAYRWLGNVRELSHVVEQTVVTHDCEELTEDMLPTRIAAATPKDTVRTLPRIDAPETPVVPTMEEMERRLIQQALDVSEWFVPAAARRLGISEATVYRKIKRYGFTRPQRC